MSDGSEWKLDDKVCPMCKDKSLWWRFVEDDECHVDCEYRCQTCGHQEWVEGSDY